MIDYLDKEHSSSSESGDRWAAILAALLVGGSIGQVYSLSVFKIPLTKLGVVSEWTQPELAWIFSISIVFLGLSAALFGKWVEREGPRRAMSVATLFWSGGFFVSSVGIHEHVLALVYLGYGVIGGIGLGIGYISPVSTLVKWFPRSPGLATGLAISGFGGGAMIGSNLAVTLMAHFSVSMTFLIMGCIYCASMLTGAAVVRIPASGTIGRIEGDLIVQGVQPLPNHDTPMRAFVPVDKAWTTPQFWCVWMVLLCNVTAGIGLLEQASPFIQECILVPSGYTSVQAASAAAGFVGLLSLANLSGRFFWSWLSDAIGRKPVYFIFLLTGAVIYASLPVLGGLTVVACVFLLSFYGGGFAAVPAYLRDLFEAQEVGAIHGRLLTAWSLAGVMGPAIVNYLRVHAIASGAVGISRYTTSFELMAVLLVIGAVSNALVRPVNNRLFVTH